MTSIGFLAPTLVEPGSGIRLRANIAMAQAIYVARGVELFFGRLRTDSGASTCS